MKKEPKLTRVDYMEDPEVKKQYTKVLPVRIQSREISNLLEQGAKLDHISNGKVSTFLRNAGIDKAKKLVREKNR